MAIDGRRFWSNSVNRDMLRVARGQSYAGNMICLAPGLHVSKFSLDHDATVERLQNIVAGSLRPCSILYEPWKGVREAKLIMDDDDESMDMDELVFRPNPVERLEISNSDDDE